jgi:hypothetical protein
LGSGIGGRWSGIINTLVNWNFPHIWKDGSMRAENKTHEDFRVNAGTPCSFKRSQVIADMALILLVYGVNKPRRGNLNRRDIYMRVTNDADFCFIDPEIERRAGFLAAELY